MIYKVYYQEHLERNPKRETTHSLYFEADSLADARVIIESNKPGFNVEFIEELSDKALTYEKSNKYSHFELTTF